MGEFRITAVRTVDDRGERLRRWAAVWALIEALPKQNSPAKKAACDPPGDGKLAEAQREGIQHD